MDLNLSSGQFQTVDSAGNRVALNGVIENIIGSQFNDTLTGNALDNYLSGLGGDDRLVGQSGRDLLIGGLGADRIVGSAGEDLIIAGRYQYENVDLALRDGSVTLPNGTLPDGTTHLVLLKGSTNSFAATVFDDFAADQITASNGPDWVFFDQPLDVVTDLNPSEDVINDGPAP
jgi:Ca2+-binding RTX toxin-like protein